MPFSEYCQNVQSGQLYYRGTSCDPSRITIWVAAAHPAGIKVVALLHRLHEITTGKDSGWLNGLSMNTMGGDIYNLSVSADTLVGNTGFTAEIRASYQFDIQSQNGELTRSAVYSDLALLPCGNRPPRTPSPITVTPTTPSSTPATPPTYCYSCGIKLPIENPLAGLDVAVKKIAETAKEETAL